METFVRGTQIEIEPNSRPFLLKRLVADGFDTVLIFGLYLAFTFLILRTPLADTYHLHVNTADAMVKEAAEKYQGDAEAIAAELNGSETYRNEALAANLHGYLLKALAIFAAEGILLLAVPLLNRERMTAGKRLAGVMPFNERRQSLARGIQIFNRFLFVFLLDSLALYLLTGTMTFLLVPVIRLTEMLLNRKNKTVCDFLTGIMIIEKLSYDGIN